MRRLLVVILVALVAVPAALAWRKATVTERARIVKALPPSYHQACIRYKIRIASADPRFAGVYFSFVKTPGKKCSPFDGQVLMKRVTAIHWKKVGEGSSWPCRLHVPGASKQVIKDIFDGCGP